MRRSPTSRRLTLARQTYPCRMRLFLLEHRISMEVQPMELRVSATGVTVFVAGGTSGINLGIAEGFARAGARVAVMSRSQDKVDRAVEPLRALGSYAPAGAATVRAYDSTSGS